MLSGAVLCRVMLSSLCCLVLSCTVVCCFVVFDAVLRLTSSHFGAVLCCAVGCYFRIRNRFYQLIGKTGYRQSLELIFKTIGTTGFFEN